jgi:hypothetical protein
MNTPEWTTPIDIDLDVMEIEIIVDPIE